MQNADNEASTSKATKEKDQQQDKQELQQEEQEEQSPTKIKTRSRFSAAFRSLSNKKPSKDLAKQQKPRSAEQLAEDLNSSESVPKRQSLTRRLLLGSLRPKTKARPHSDELSLRSSSGSRERGLGGNTLQITISGKKVETLTKGKAKPSKSKSQRTSAVSETDYLNPTPAETAAAAAATGATAAAAAAAASVKTTTTTLTTKDTTSRTTKLIVAKVSAQQQLKKKRQQQQQLRVATEAPQTEEKIVITESTRDTPPRERAPAKPSRASATNNQLASSSTAVRIASTSSKVSQSSRKERALMQQQQQRGHRLTTAKHALQTPTSPQPEPEPEPEPETESPTTPPPPLPANSPPEISLSDVEQQADAVSLAESAQTTSNQDTVAAAPVVRFAVGSAVRSPVDAYEAALAAAAASTQQPSSSEEPSDSSLRRLSFKQQQPQFALSDHDSIEGRRETLRYQSVASEYSNEEDTQSEEEHQQQSKPMPAFGDLTMDQQMEPTIMSPSGEKREHLYKILVIGELGTGKTSFIKRYVHQFFSQNYRATIGVDFALKVLHWDANTIVRLQLWDIAGQERFGNMTRVYYKEAVGAFIVFDVTRSGTFDCVSKWKEDLDSKVQLPDGSPIPCILLANKCDQEKQGIVTQPERMDEYVRENGFAGWFETSAKENINIDEAARALVNKILINDKLITADANDAEKFNLSAADASADAKNKCSC